MIDYSLSVNISSSFMARARCGKCGDFPKHYYFVYKPTVCWDVRQYLKDSKESRGFIKKIVYNRSLLHQNKNFMLIFSVSSLSFLLEDKGYNSPHHHTPIQKSSKSPKDEVAYCMCGHTVWIFNQKSIQHCPEIKNRKGKISYSKKLY